MVARGLVQGDVLIFFCILLALVYCRFRTVFMFHRHHHVFPIQKVFPIKILILLIPEPLAWQKGPQGG